MSLLTNTNAIPSKRRGTTIRSTARSLLAQPLEEALEFVFRRLPTTGLLLLLWLWSSTASTPLCLWNFWYLHGLCLGSILLLEYRPLPRILTRLILPRECDQCRPLESQILNQTRCAAIRHIMDLSFRVLIYQGEWLVPCNDETPNKLEHLCSRFRGIDGELDSSLIGESDFNPCFHNRRFLRLSLSL